MLKEKRDKRFISILSIILVLLGIAIISIQNINNKIQEKEDIELLESFISTQESISDVIEINTNDTESNIIKQSIDNSYLAVLEIPRINLKRGFFDKNSKKNNVNKNVYMLKESEMPTIQNSNLILAAHSGNSRVAFFNDLKKLKLDDEAIINYNGQNFIYKLMNYYEIDKTGKANIVRNNDKTTLTLITCKQKTKKQYIFIFELQKVEGGQSE